ncbi:MAG TPA: N-acetyltransferase, partial [Blastocatellia bacterium]|nr:N-acetyltransferase [Blastocatellia bacterium]
EETPELTIALLPEFRGRGIGEKLMTQMLSHALNHHAAVCLSVSPDNPALRLYQKLGFETVKEEGASLTMVRKFV